MDDCARRETEHKRQKKNLHIEQQKASANLDRLEGELSEATPDASVIKEAERDLEDAKKQAEKEAELLEDVKKQLAEYNTDNQVHKREVDEATDRVAHLESKLGKAKQTVQSFQIKRDEALKAKNEAIKAVEAAEENKNEWIKHLTEQRVDLDQIVQEARQICEERVPVPPGKTAERLLDELRRLEQTRKQCEDELGGSQDMLLRAANEAKKEHNQAMQELEEIKSLRNHLITTLTNRRNRWQLFRSGISIRARVTFNYLLSERKFRGTLSIDHKNALLDIHVSGRLVQKSTMFADSARSNQIARN